MIVHHTLDSALWEIVEPFYHQPISVPYGESAILMQLFPELEVDLPVSEQELSKYIPWGKGNIAQFFKDWPELLYFKPILDFSMNVPVKSGRICVSVDRNGVSGESAQRMQFSLEPLSCFSLDGRFSFTESYARWKNRILRITPGKWCSFMAGNVTPHADRHGLVSGAFAGRKKNENTVKDNWLYGDKRGWNTIVMNFSTEKLMKKVTFEPFLHKRELETVAGIAADILLNETIESEFDFIGMDVKEIEDTLLYGVSSTKFKFSTMEAEITLAASVKAQPAVPVRFGLNYSREMDKLKVEMVYLPEGFIGPRSNVLEDFAGYDSIFNPVKTGIFSSEMAWKHHVTECVTATPSLTLRTSDLSLMYLNPGISVSMQEKRYRLTIEYQRFEPLRDESTRNVDYFRLDCLTELFKKNDMQVDMCVRHFTDNRWYVSTILKQEFQLSPETQITPGIKYNKYSGRLYNLALSLAYTMSLFNAIYSDCSIEKYISLNEKQGPLRLNAKLWFAF